MFSLSQTKRRKNSKGERRPCRKKVDIILFGRWPEGWVLHQFSGESGVWWNYMMATVIKRQHPSDPQPPQTPRPCLNTAGSERWASTSPRNERFKEKLFFLGASFIQSLPLELSKSWWCHLVIISLCGHHLQYWHCHHHTSSDVYFLSHEYCHLIW